MAEKVVYVDPKELIIIGLDTADNEEHVLWDRRAFWEPNTSLVKSMQVMGVINPIKVREESGRLLVVDGRQRVKAARVAVDLQEAAGEHVLKVPTLIEIGDDSRIAGVAVASNELRKNDDVLDKAFSAVKLYSFQKDIDYVAIAYGRSTTTIRNWFSLTEADPRIHKAIREGQISVTAGVELSRYDRDKQVPALEAVLKQAMRGKATTEAVKQVRRDDGELAGSESKARAANGDTGEEGDGLPPEVDIMGAKPTKPKGPTKTGGNARQLGVKRTWLRKALKTEAAKRLTDEQRGVLAWIALGEAKEGTWYEQFEYNAEEEMGE